MDRATRERIRTEAAAVRAAKQQPAPPAPAPARAAAPVPTPARKPEPAPKPDAPPTKVRCSCGHMDANIPCGKCRSAVVAARVERNRLKREAKSAAQAAPDSDQGRLPDGALFHVLYDASVKRWSGRLQIGEAVFEGQATGVFRLLQTLDGEYRRALVAQSPATPTAAVAAQG